MCKEGKELQSSTEVAGRSEFALLSAAMDRVDFLVGKQNMAKKRNDNTLETFFDGRVREAQWFMNLINECKGG